MSTTTTVTVHCDGEGCLFWCDSGAHSQSIRSARKEARRVGWTYERGRDLCPACRTHLPRPVEPEPLPEGARSVPIGELLARAAGDGDQGDTER